jgi:hypothetical protein
VEPFNQWFKSTAELDQRVWHRGVYQLLVRHNYRTGNKNGRIKWILDGL